MKAPEPPLVQYMKQYAMLVPMKSKGKGNTSTDWRLEDDAAGEISDDDDAPSEQSMEKAAHHSSISGARFARQRNGIPMNMVPNADAIDCASSEAYFGSRKSFQNKYNSLVPASDPDKRKTGLEKLQCFKRQTKAIRKKRDELKKKRQAKAGATHRNPDLFPLRDDQLVWIYEIFETLPVSNNESLEQHAVRRRDQFLDVRAANRFAKRRIEVNLKQAGGADIREQRIDYGEDRDSMVFHLVRLKNETSLAVWYDLQASPTASLGQILT
jgi:hypothetical protein